MQLLMQHTIIRHIDVLPGQVYFCDVEQKHLVAQGFHAQIAFSCQNRKQLGAGNAIERQDIWWKQYSETTLNYIHSK